MNQKLHWGEVSAQSAKKKEKEKKEVFLSLSEEINVGVWYLVPM